MRDLFARLVMHDGRPDRSNRPGRPPQTLPSHQEKTMTFEYRDSVGDALIAKPTIGTLTPGILLHIEPSNCVHVPLDRVEEVVAGIRDAARQAAGQTPTEPGVVAHRSRYAPELLLCREHYQGWPGFTPLTSEDLPDGGICTWGRSRPNECGRDVLAEPEPVVEQPAEAQPARVQWRVELYDPLAKEWAPGAAFSSRERAEERLRMAHIHSPRWADDQTPVKRRLVRETTTWTVEEIR